MIERGKGRLMERHKLSEDEAFRRLRRAAMNSRRPMADIAQALLVSESVAEGCRRLSSWGRRPASPFPKDTHHLAPVRPLLYASTRGQ